MQNAECRMRTNFINIIALIIMFFYIIHQIIHYLLPSGENEEDQGKKNVRTFIFGGVLYIILFGLLHSPLLQTAVSANVMLQILRDWFVLFLLLDVGAMAITYKLFWSRSITHEVKEIVALKNEESESESESEPELELDARSDVSVEDESKSELSTDNFISNICDHVHKEDQSEK